MNLGILGGTFNPVHWAHLRLAAAARDQLQLERVLFIPAGDPPLKHSDVAPAHHRLEMVRRALADYPDFDALALEVERRGPSYTLDTLRELEGLFPGSALWFICGADALATVDQWYRHEQLFEHSNFAVVGRPGSAGDLDALMPKNLAAQFQCDAGEWIHRSGHRVRLIEFEMSQISASAIRHDVGAGRKIDALVPQAVAKYIDEHGLYREAA